MPDGAPEPEWMAREATDSLVPLQDAPEFTPRAGIALYTNEWSKREIELTDEWQQLERTFSLRRKGYETHGMEAGLDAGMQILREGRPGVESPQPHELLIFFGVRKVEFQRPEILRLVAAFRAAQREGVTVILACPGRNDLPRLFCDPIRELADVLGVGPVAEAPGRGVLRTSMEGDLAALLAPQLAAGGRVNVIAGPGLDLLPGSVSGSPAVSESHDGTHLTWSWVDEPVTSTRRVVFGLVGRANGVTELSGVVAVTNTDQLAIVGAAQPVSITVSGSSCVVATPSPTLPPPTPTRTPDLRPIYLPVLLKEECVRELRSVDVALVIDTSSSMEQEVSPGLRKIDAAITAARAFLDILNSSDQASIIGFDGPVIVAAGLTSNRSILNRALDGLRTHQFTRIDLGLAAARIELTGPARVAAHAPVIVLLTDGRANPVPIEAAEQEAAAAKAAGITIFAIGLGQPDALDHEALKRIATKPAYYYQTPDVEDLVAIYTSIAGLVPCPPGGFWGHR